MRYFRGLAIKSSISESTRVAIRRMSLYSPGSLMNFAIEPSPLSNQWPCHLGETGLIPAANARRFTLIFDVPAGMPRKLQYRGFEKDEVIVEIKR